VDWDLALCLPLVVGGVEEVMSRQADTLHHIFRTVMGKDDVNYFMLPLISFGSNSPRLAATSDALAIELYDAC